MLVLNRGQWGREAPGACKIVNQVQGRYWWPSCLTNHENMVLWYPLVGVWVGQIRSVAHTWYVDDSPHLADCRHALLHQ